MSTEFDEIVAGLEDAIAHAEGDGSRAFSHETLNVSAIRKKTGLSQRKFSALFMVSIGTLRNWEQERRTPRGPARALLKVIDKDPEVAVKALHGGA